MLARIPIVPVLLLTMAFSLVALVLAIVGAPMAGMAGAVEAIAGALVLTIPMALVFSHAADPAKGH